MALLNDEGVLKGLLGLHEEQLCAYIEIEVMYTGIQKFALMVFSKLFLY